MMEYNAIYDPLSTRKNEQGEWHTVRTTRVVMIRKNPIFAEKE